MDTVIWAGAALSLLGVAGLLYSMVLVARARRAKLADEELRARISKVLPLNMGALFLSVIGLMLVVIGIAFG